MIKQNQIDLREVAPKDRHVTVFRAFDSLMKGDAFVLVVDHDPKPLFGQFSEQRPGGFNWEYTQQGPLLWQVKIEKIADTGREEESEEGCCGICSSH